MDVQENAPLSAGDDSLSMITELRGAEAAEAPATTEEATPEPVETPVEVVEEESEEALEARRNALLREIAIDPGLTTQYVQQQYQQPQQQVQPQPPQQSQLPAPQASPLPFDEFSFDKDNPEHLQALMDYRLENKLQAFGGPLVEMVEKIYQRYEQQEQLQQQQQMQQVADYTNQKTVEFLDTYVPGFKGIAEKIGSNQPLSAKEKAIFNEAVNAESYFLQQYPQAVYDVRLRAQIAQHIGPALKDYAKELGLVAQPSKPTLTPEAKQQMKREMYVESSNAVPAAGTSSFEKALESGDSLQMIRALRAT